MGDSDSDIECIEVGAGLLALGCCHGFQLFY